eukprot:6455593-Amphidinium_carterae.2
MLQLAPCPEIPGSDKGFVTILQRGVLEQGKLLHLVVTLLDRHWWLQHGWGTMWAGVVRSGGPLLEKLLAAGAPVGRGPVP